VALPESTPEIFPPESARAPPRVIGRYAVYGEIGSGGMATVYFGRLRGAGGFSRPVAIKRLHPHFAKTPRFVDAFLDEARLAAQIRHPNVVPTLDVVNESGELLLVMEYIVGASLSELWDIETAFGTGGARIAPGIAASVVAGALHGLHAAHEAKDDDGHALSIVHRDVSPHNIIVGDDGVARVLDFGVAKAEQRIRTTNPGEVKGKLAYMAPEQIMLEQASPRSDIYAAGVVLWEALTGQWLFRADNHGALISKILGDEVKPPSSFAPEVTPALDAIVMRALSRNAEERFESAEAFAHALEANGTAASTREVATWVTKTAGEAMARRAAHAAAVERARPSSTDVLWEVTDDSALEPKSERGESTTTSDAPASASVPLPATAATDVAASVRIDPAPPERRRSAWAALLFLAFAAFAGVAWFLAGARPKEPTRAAPPSVPSVASAGTTVAPNAASAPTATPAQLASSSDAASPPPASASPAPLPKHVPPHITALPPRPQPPPPPPHPDCSPPFTMDSDGIKHLKRECL
jgi:serine/threonine protein kinase